MADEIKLNFSLAPEGQGRLKSLPILQAMSLNRARRQRMVSVYFDTPSLALEAAGITLCVHRIGQRYVQMLKIPLGKSGMAQAYAEFKATGATARPALRLVGDAEAAARLARAVGGEPLEEVFAADLTSKVWRLLLEDTKFELTLEVGEIHAGRLGIPVSELELELIEGEQNRLFELGLAINELVPLSIERSTKTARGYALVAGRQPGWATAKADKLDLGMSLVQSFATLARSCMAQLAANEACALAAENSEGIHQMRVAVRRFRALISAFRTVLSSEAHGDFSRELRWLMKQLGPARDWDVFIDETLQPLEGSVRDVPSLQALRAAAEALRQQAYAQVHQAILSPRYTAMRLRTELRLRADESAVGGVLAETRITRHACAILQRRHRKLHKMGKSHKTLDEPALHRVRIEAKKLRYAGEFFRSLYPPKATRKYLGALAALQDCLGSLNDSVVGRQLIEALVPQMITVDKAPRVEVNLACGLVRGWQVARVQNDLKAFDNAWQAYLDRKPFWTKG